MRVIVQHAGNDYPGEIIRRIAFGCRKGLMVVNHIS